MPVILKNMNALAPDNADAPVIDRENYAIRGVSVIQAGPALGHNFHVDDVMLNQVSRFINETPRGVKSRLTHPGLTECGGRDGVEMGLGRLRNARVEGDRVRGDLFLGRFAANSPSGDLRGFVMDLAEDDPEQAGMSIVFSPDEPDFEIIDEEEPETLPSADVDGKFVKRFARVKDVLASDLVGDPAANRSGLLERLGQYAELRIGPEIIKKWATELKSMVAADGPAAVIITSEIAPLHGGTLMPKQLRTYLETNNGLSKSATVAEAKALFDSLAADVQTKINQTLGIGADPAPAPADTPAAAATVLTQADVERLTLERLTRADEERRQREREIYALAKNQLLGDDWALQHIMEGHTLEQAKDDALKKAAESRQPIPHLAGSGISVGVDLNSESLGPAITDALCVRSGVNQYQHAQDFGRPCILTDGNGNNVRRDLHERHTSFLGQSILDLNRMYLAALGAPDVLALSRKDLFELTKPREVRRRYPSLAQGTGDFANLLLDAMNKNMLNLYLDAPVTWPIWARMRTAPDFKNINIIGISESASLAENPEGGEIKYVQLTDTKEAYALVEYNGGIALTRRSIVNDDMDAFSRIPMIQAAAARRKEEDVAYAIITDNSAMDQDSVALFHTATHGNLIASGGAPSESEINSTNQLVRKQTGPKSASRLDLNAAFILGPVEHDIALRKFFENSVLPGGNNSEMNVWQGRFQPITNVRLSDNSATAWYLMSDYRDGLVDTIEVAFLEGEQTPVLAQENDFDTDDRRFKIRHTVAAKAADWRGIAKNPGA